MISRRALIGRAASAAALAALPALVATARSEGAALRLACLRPFPAPREDRHGRVVADVDREMARITRTLEATFTAGARVFDDVTLDCVVRFGRPRREARLEREAWTPDVVASFEGRRALSAIRYLVTGRRRSAASASAASRVTSAAAFWRRAMRTP